MSNHSKDINVLACKYDGSVHRSWKARLLKSESNIIVLNGIFEFEIEHTSLGLIEKGTKSIEYYWLDRWFNVFAFYKPLGDLRNYYCNINVPPKFNGDTLSFIDLDLDILVSPEMEITLLDVDEFRINKNRYKYTEDILLNTEKAKQELLSLIKKREFPFNH